MYIGKNIRFLRKKAGYSQEELAGILRYKSFTTIQKWEAGDSFPPYPKLMELAELFQVNIHDLSCKDLSLPQTFDPALISQKEMDLLLKYRTLNRKQKAALDSMLDSLCEMQDDSFIAAEDTETYMLKEGVPKGQ